MKLIFKPESCCFDQQAKEPPPIHTRSLVTLPKKRFDIAPAVPWIWLLGSFML
jgi:hypothetical protein